MVRLATTWFTLILTLLMPNLFLAQSTSSPSHPAAVLARAEELRKQHHGQAASTLLEHYLAEHANDPEALTLLARIRLDAGDEQDARLLLVQALNANPTSSAANRLAGSMLFKEGQYPQAMDRFETVLASHPQDREARSMEREAALKLAGQAQTAGHPEAALQVLEHAREKLPDDADLLLGLGMTAFDLNRLPEAEQALTTARKLNPSSPEVLYGLARVELEEQHMAEAESDMRAYLVMRPADASAHFGLGHIYAMQLRTDLARAEFERSIQLKPVQTESYYQLGQLLLDSHQDQQAAPLFARVIARNPNHGGALAGLGQIAFREKKYDEAQRDLEQAVKVAPEYASAHYYLGLVLLRLGKKLEGDQELRLAAQIGHDAGIQPAQP